MANRTSPQREIEVSEHRNKTANHPPSKHDLISERIHSQMYRPPERAGPADDSTLEIQICSDWFKHIHLGHFRLGRGYKELPLWATKELIIEFFRNEPPDRSEIISRIFF